MNVKLSSIPHQRISRKELDHIHLKSAKTKNNSKKIGGKIN